jgi:gamma-glutamylcyclotransferase (GGCT)/AIG2-like uncharacterized protein YtfP
MVITRADIFIDLMKSHERMLEEDAYGIPYDIKRLKQVLSKNNSAEDIRVWARILRNDIEETIEHLDSICEVADEIIEEVDEVDEEPKEYIATFNRMFSLP